VPASALEDYQQSGITFLRFPGGLIWLQDFALEGQPFDEVRADETVRQDVELTVSGLTDGTYHIQPYNTWQGEATNGTGT
jgi:hypothetical protein